MHQSGQQHGDENNGNCGRYGCRIEARYAPGDQNSGNVGDGGHRNPGEEGTERHINTDFFNQTGRQLPDAQPLIDGNEGEQISDHQAGSDGGKFIVPDEQPRRVEQVDEHEQKPDFRQENRATGEGAVAGVADENEQQCVEQSPDREGEGCGREQVGVEFGEFALIDTVNGVHHRPVVNEY